ncbi:uncharacterized protein EDB91DRAFT_1084016 [Suillus paluster]|uniref:uncharacterized protein n=1 Tax=Suillus paluster TaxID=48578 RepID=UPI001B86E015|nr:uncharacterized protein EDB91DRAFT_1084016 [Suillus paluster]KAG1734741.1 hypothetical protein EDB91DRAFT_1084016 [Suillus paluster]
MRSHHSGKAIPCNIFTFLSYNEIIYCTLICQTIYNTVKNSVELQYAIELGAQRLIPVHPRPHTASLADCLRTLKGGKANAWNSFELNVTKKIRVPSSLAPRFIIHRQLCVATPPILTDYYDLKYKVVDSDTCTPETVSAPPRAWSKDSDPNPVPGNLSAETQDLMIAVNMLSDSHASDFV